MTNSIHMKKNLLLIEKVDMVSLVINQSLAEIIDLWNMTLQGWWQWGIIKTETLDDSMILSFVDSKSRDELFNLLVQKIEKL